MFSADIFHYARPVTVSVTVAGRVWQLREASARDWIGAVSWDLKLLSGVVPGMLRDDDLEDMADVMLQHPDVGQRWMYAARVALGRGSGRDWWWSLNLIERSVKAWPYINGMLMLRGVRADTMPLPEWLDAAYMLLRENADEAGRKALDMELQLPPMGVAAPKAAVDKMLADFASD